MKNIIVGLSLLLSSCLASAGIINFDINQSFSQGNGTSDLSPTSVSLGAAGTFIVDPGASSNYFDFVFSGTGTFSTINTQLGSYYFLDSYVLGETVGAGNFGMQVSSGGDWDTILVSNQTAGVWNTTHSGYVGFKTDANLFGWIGYDYTRSAGTSTINFLSGAYNDIANADIVISGAIVPEPESIALLGLSLLGFGLLRRKNLNF